MRRSLVAGLAVGAVMLLAACGGADESSATPSVTSSPVTTTPAPSALTTSSATPSVTVGATPSATTATRNATRTAKPSPTKAKPRPTATRTTASAASCAVPRGVTATQVVLVTSSGSRATIRACTRTGGRYVTSLGPYSGHVGKNGVSSSKREGDLRTPTGVFPLRGGFGARANPGLRVGSWLRVDSRDVWVDDASSSLYNTHQRTPAAGRWSSAEPLLNTPAYNYAQVIGYNEARTPGRGSAIFLHVDLGHGTAGCVSLPTSGLLAVMRWERAGAVIAIR